MASAKGHLEIIKWLYEQGVDPTINNNYAIRLASQYGHLEVVKFLHSIGCDPTTNHNFAIRWASNTDHLEIVKFLALVERDTNKIEDLEMRKTAEYYKKYKHLFNKCLSEIYGHPALERTRTENEKNFQDYQENNNV